MNSCVTPCGSCLCNTCQANVDAPLKISRTDEYYCYNCDTCSKYSEKNLHCKYKGNGECDLYICGADIKRKVLYGKKM